MCVCVRVCGMAKHDITPGVAGWRCSTPHGPRFSPLGVCGRWEELDDVVVVVSVVLVVLCCCSTQPLGQTLALMSHNKCVWAPIAGCIAPGFSGSSMMLS